MANLKTPLIVIVAVVVGAVGYAALTMKDQRSPTDKIGDAVHELPNGFDKAARELGDRTPAEKMGDAIKDEKDKIQDTTSP